MMKLNIKLPVISVREDNNDTAHIEESGRRALLIIALIMLIPPIMFFGIRNIRLGLYHYGVIDCILDIVFAIFVFMLFRGREVKYIFYTVAVMFTLLLLYWVSTGAINGTASIWVLVYPSFFFFILGRKKGLAWSLTLGVFTAMMFIFPSLSFTGFVYDKDYVSRHLVSLALIILIAYYYDAMREKYKNAMESEQRKLVEHQATLEQIVEERTRLLNEKLNELEAGEKRLRLFTDNIDDLIWSVDSGMKFTYISPSVTGMYGYTMDEAMGLPHEKWYTPESYVRMIKQRDEELRKNSQGVEPERYAIMQFKHLKKDGTIFPVEVKVSSIRDEQGRITGFTGISRDISSRIEAEHEKEKIQEQLAQAQKMEAVGTLAGGLAHDFNNYLGGIMGSFELIKRIVENSNIEKRPMLDKYLKIGLDAAKKSADLIRELLSLSKKIELHVSPVNICTSLEHVSELCRNSFPKSVEIEFDGIDTPAYVMGDAAQIEQVLLNLCINASHAMTIMRGSNERQGGRLTVSASVIMSQDMPHDLSDSAGEVMSWSRIRVEDTGVGMSGESMKKIFEPFFSTKDKGEGTGLGLAISYSIIQKHGGFIDVRSEKGKGSCFTLYLPVCSDELLIPQGENAPGIEHGSGTILVIDDEIFMLNIARAFLEQCGYDVITAEGAEGGIETYRLHSAKVAAVLIDFSMPVRNGLEVFDELKKINPGIRALLSSGMLDNETIANAMNLGIIETVTKPYTTAELSIKIKKSITP